MSGEIKGHAIMTLLPDRACDKNDRDGIFPATEIGGALAASKGSAYFVIIGTCPGNLCCAVRVNCED